MGHTAFLVRNKWSITHFSNCLLFSDGSCYVGQLSPELMSLLLWSLLKPRSQACATKSSK